MTTPNTLPAGHTKAIHHATLKRAARLDVQIVMLEGGQFAAKNLETGDTSNGYDTTAELLEAVEAGDITYNEPEFEDDEPRVSGSVVRKPYHVAYSKNPHGPGCGDDLDVALRNAVMVTTDENREPHVDLAELRRIGIHNDLWRGEWEALNPGMQRMNLSNRLRAFLRNHEDAQVWLGASGNGRFGVPYNPAKGRKSKKTAVELAVKAEQPKKTSRKAA